MADEVDATFEDEEDVAVELDHEREGGCIMGSAMSARDVGSEVGVVVDIVKKPVYRLQCGAETPHRQI